MTDVADPAAHIEFVESAGAEYEVVIGHASRYRRLQAVKRVVAILLVIPYIGLAFAITSKDNGWAVVGGVTAVVVVLGFILWVLNVETVRAARRGLWSKSGSVVVEAEGEVSTTPAYLVLRPSGVYVQAVSTEWLRAQFRTEYAFPWSSLNSVEFARRGSRWRSVVISGPGVRIAPIGSVDVGFADALRELGAEPPD